MPPGALLYGDAPQQRITSVADERLRQRREQAEGLSIDFRRWAVRVPEPKAGKLDLDKYPFQRELYDETGDLPEVVVKKATQVGVSAYLTRWVMYHADVRGVNSLYVFPKLQQMYDFSDARIRASIERSEYLMSRIPPGSVANKGLRRIGLGWCYFRGSESKTALDSIDADVLALDEYDTLVQENIPDAERRITGSESGLIRRVGVPSIPGWGIDALYASSDARRWFVRCDPCGERQYLTYDENVDVPNGDPEDEKPPRIVCRKCRKPLDVSEGEWVAEFPGRRVRGYHLPRLIVPHANLRTIAKAADATKPNDRKVHFNKDLAEAFAEAEGRLSREAIASCQRGDLQLVEGFKRGPGVGGVVTMGVDVASARDLHVRISHVGEEGRRRCLWLGEVENFDAVRRLFKLYDVGMCAIDHLPEGRLARAITEHFAGRAYIVAFATQKQVLKVDEDTRLCTVRRTEALDATLDAFRMQENLIPAVGLPEDYVSHLQNATRVIEEDPLTGKKTVTYQNTGPIDHLMADCYDLIAGELALFRATVDKATEGETYKLDDRIDFERSQLGFENDDGGYEPGLDDEYNAGFE